MIGFTPISATIGGALIGGGVGLLWIANGRVGGISNILSSLVVGSAAQLPWRLLFLIGLPIGAAVGIGLLPELIPDMETAEPVLDIGPIGLAIAGLLVGVGTALARGCTSGHGVFGLARLSIRSIVSVLLFTVTAMLTVWLVRHGR